MALFRKRRGGGRRTDRGRAGSAGTFDGVDLRPRARERLRNGGVRLKVLAAGLNFRDVLLALDLYPGSGVPVGAECAGVRDRTDRFALVRFLLGSAEAGFFRASCCISPIGSQAITTPGSSPAS